MRKQRRNRRIPGRNSFAFLLAAALMLGAAGSAAPIPAEAAEAGGIVAVASPQRMTETAVSVADGETGTEDAAEQPCVMGEALVCYKAETGVTSEDAAAATAERELEKDSSVDDAEGLMYVDDTEEGISSGLITLVRSDRLTTDELVEDLSKRDDVLYAEPNYIYEAAEADLHTSEQWEHTTTYGIHDEGWNTFDGGTPSPKVDTSKQVVAVIDTGIDYNHEDLKNNMWTDGEKYPVLKTMGGGKYGLNAILYRENGNKYDSRDPMDDYGHGTHCAGIIAAEWNKIGTSGIAPGAKLMAVKICDEKGHFHLDAMIRGFRYVIAAKKAGVNVVATNNSYGGNAKSFSELLVLKEAADAGIVNVFAAANDSLDMNVADSSNSLRGRVPGSIVVGCSNVKGKASDFSNYGTREVDVFAPGEDIISTVPTGTGPATMNSPVLTMDGVTYDMDFSDKTDVSSDLLGLNHTGVTKSLVEAEGGKKVLQLKDTDGSDGGFIVESKLFKDARKCMGGVIRLYVPGKQKLHIVVNEITSLEETKKLTAVEGTADKGYYEFGFSYPESLLDEDKQDVRFQLEVEVTDPTTGKPVPYLNIARLRLNSEAGNYDVKSGTSMSAPLVAGAVAALAAEHPQDTPEKLAARVTGSVLPVDSLKDKCVSGGIFRMDKALAGETVPVLTSAKAGSGTFTLDGYFFGTAKGTVTVNGTACTVKEWTDTKITAELPKGFAAGEKDVAVTSDAGTGHRFLRMGSQADLYPRLPLPGSIVAADGQYEIPESALKQYADFYGGDPKALVGLNGYVYCLLGSTEKGTIVYRYKISNKTWEKVCTSADYAITGGACAWNGKILFTAAVKEEEENAIGVLDPGSRTIKWSSIEMEGYQNAVSIINNGYGIYLMGGERGLRTEDNDDYSYVRQLDPVNMEISTLDGPGPVGLNNSLGCDDEGQIRALSCYKATIPANVIYSTISISGETSRMKPMGDGDTYFPDMVLRAELTGTGVYTKKGFLVTGFPKTDSNEMVTEDTYLISKDGTKATKQDKIMSFRPMYLLTSTGYQGNAYFLGASNSEAQKLVFVGIPAETYAPIGEKAYSNEWVKGIWYGKAGFRGSDHPRRAGWKKNSKGWWYEDAGGWYPKKQWQKIDGKWYYFNEKGYMEAKAYRDGYYLSADGACSDRKVGSWKKDSKGWWYSLAGGSYLKKRWAMINGKWYYFDARGYMASSEWVKGYWLSKSGAWTYQPRGSWRKNSKGWWYGDTSGWYAKDQTQKINGKKYHFDAKGYCTNP